MAVHDDVIFPTDIRLESSARLHDEVTELFAPGGQRMVINRREEPLTVLDVSYIGSTSEARAIYDFIFALRRGQTGLIRNPSFWNTSSDQHNADAVTNLDMKLYNPTDDDYEGDGSTTVFQLQVQIEPGAALSQTKRIRKPRTASIVIAEAGIPLVPASINAANGEVTFSVAPGNGNAMTWGGEWWLPMFNASDDLTVEQLIGHNATATEGLVFMEDVL